MDDSFGVDDNACSDRTGAARAREHPRIARSSRPRESIVLGSCGNAMQLRDSLHLLVAAVRIARDNGLVEHRIRSIERLDLARKPTTEIDRRGLTEVCT